MQRGNEVAENNMSFTIFNFENKLIEVIEELRLKRQLEVENEKNLKKTLQEKYDLETLMEEQHRKFLHEKNDLEQEIMLLKRKLEDRFCVADEEKVKLQLITKTFAQEVKALKEESRLLHSDKLNLEKRIQELEGKLKLHNNFQETAIRQMNNVRQEAQELSNFCQNLTLAQKDVKDNVSEVRVLLEKYELCNKHLSSIINMNEQQIASLKKDIVTLRTKLSMKDSAINFSNKVSGNSGRSEENKQTIYNLENMLLQTRNESKKNTNNLLESSKLLVLYANKLDESEKANTVESNKTQMLRSELDVTREKLDETLSKLMTIEQDYNHMMTLRKDMISEETQVNSVLECFHNIGTQTDKCFILPLINPLENDKDVKILSDTDLSTSNVVDDVIALESSFTNVESEHNNVNSLYQSPLKNAANVNNIVPLRSSGNESSLQEVRIHLKHHISDHNCSVQSIACKQEISTESVNSNSQIKQDSLNDLIRESKSSTGLSFDLVMDNFDSVSSICDNMESDDVMIVEDD